MLRDSFASTLQVIASSFGHRMNPFRLVIPLVAGAFALLGVSCAVAPAKLVRHQTFGDGSVRLEKMSLHSLLEVALENPNRDESARALGHFVSEWRSERGVDIAGEVGPNEESGDRYRVRFSDKGTFRFLPSYFDKIRPADSYKVKRIESYTRNGIGAPLIAVRENTGREPIEAFYPPEVISREVTAVMRPGRVRAGVREVEIELIGTLSHESVTVGGRREPLAADFSAPYAALLERGKALSHSEVGDLLSSKPKRDPQLYLMEPYDPGKETVLMIHGLLDSPLAWAEMTNQLRSDSGFRKRYQVWHYLYNTSAPALYSGRILRNQLAELRGMVDPGRNDRASKEVTIVAHSMGGLVTRSLISSPGNAFWEAGFTRPISSLTLSDTDRVALQDAFFWKADPGVQRVVFICVPHRGSAYADKPIARFARNFVKPPDEFREFYERISTANPGAFTPAYEELGRGELDSVGSLSPQQPTLKILVDIPLGYPVELFSVIGDKGLPGELEESSDGVVPYSSSHLDEVGSEIILPVGHSCLREPDTIAEVQRILKLP